MAFSQSQFQPSNMSTLLENQAGLLALEGINTNLPRIFKRLSEAFKSKGLTLEKILQMYVLLKKCIEDIEAILKSK